MGELLPALIKQAGGPRFPLPAAAATTLSLAPGRFATTCVQRSGGHTPVRDSTPTRSSLIQRIYKMPMPSKDEAAEDIQKGAFQYATAWGENSIPPALTASLIAAQHLRPFQLLPMLFPPILLFSSYLNVSGYVKDAAGLTSAWSAAYLLLARRRKQAFSSKFGARGMVRGATLGLCVVNVVSGGVAYAFGKREVEEESR